MEIAPPPPPADTSPSVQCKELAGALLCRLPTGYLCNLFGGTLYVSLHLESPLSLNLLPSPVSQSREWWAEEVGNRDEERDPEYELGVIYGQEQSPFILNLVNWASWCPIHGPRPCSDPARRVAFLRGATCGDLCFAYLIRLLPKHGPWSWLYLVSASKSASWQDPRGILMPS